MGDSFSDVQVHTGPKAAQACDDINARAFTVGNNIAFNHGEYDPGSPEGQHVLAHELAHVRQQTGGAVSMLPQENLELEIDPDPELEREAEETAQRVMQGGELGIQRMSDTDVHVQRRTNYSRTRNLVANTRPGQDRENWETTGPSESTSASVSDRLATVEEELETVKDSVDENAKAILDNNQTLQEMQSVPEEIADLDLGELTEEDGNLAEELGGGVGYGFLGELVKKSGEEGGKQLLVQLGIASAGAAGGMAFPPALLAAVAAAMLSGGAVAAVQNRDSITDKLKGLLPSENTREEKEQETSENGGLGIF